MNQKKKERKPLEALPVKTGDICLSGPLSFSRLYILYFHADTLRGKPRSQGPRFPLFSLAVSNTCSEPTPAIQSPRDPCSGLQRERNAACAPQGAKGSGARQRALETVIVGQTVGVFIHMQNTAEANCQSRESVRSEDQKHHGLS